MWRRALQMSGRDRARQKCGGLVDETNPIGHQATTRLMHVSEDS